LHFWHNALKWSPIKGIIGSNPDRYADFLLYTTRESRWPTCRRLNALVRAMPDRYRRLPEDERRQTWRGCSALGRPRVTRWRPCANIDRTDRVEIYSCATHRTAHWSDTMRQMTDIGTRSRLTQSPGVCWQDDAQTAQEHTHDPNAGQRTVANEQHQRS
jgi:hypothetical protein